MQLAQPGPELLADLGVEGPERLVEQEHPRLDGQGPGQGHALALPAGELGGVPVRQVRDAHQIEQFVDPRPDLGLGTAPDLEPEGHVPTHRQVAEGRVVLEAEADPPVAHRNGGHVLAVDLDGAGVGHLQAGDDPQQGGLAAAARSKQGGQGPLGDLEGHVVESDGVSEPLGDVSDADRHLRFLLSGSEPNTTSTIRARRAKMTAPA